MGAGGGKTGQVFPATFQGANTTVGTRIGSAATFQDFDKVKKQSLFQEYEFLDDMVVEENVVERRIIHMETNNECLLKIYK